MAVFSSPITVSKKLFNLSRRAQLYLLCVAIALLGGAVLVSGLVLVKDDLLGSGSETGKPILGWLDIGIGIIWIILSSIFIDDMLRHSTENDKEEKIRLLKKTQELDKATVATATETIQKREQLIQENENKNNSSGQSSVIKPPPYEAPKE